MTEKEKQGQSLRDTEKDTERIRDSESEKETELEKEPRDGGEGETGQTVTGREQQVREAG